MPNQGNIWDREYKNPLFVTKNDGPQMDTKRFLKFLKKEEKYKVEDRTILDLGCGTGRNANYLAELENEVIGIEISKMALEIARARASERELLVDYRLGDIGEKYEIEDNSIDIVLDVTSSNSLDEAGREIYLKEVSRVLKNGGPRPAEASSGGGYFFCQSTCQRWQQECQKLIETKPG